jgi:hypothetical protein
MIMSTKKFRIVITTVVEYDVDPQYYEGCASYEDILACDLTSANEDPVLFMDMPTASTTVNGEIV